MFRLLKSEEYFLELKLTLQRTIIPELHHNFMRRDMLVDLLSTLAVAKKRKIKIVYKT